MSTISPMDKYEIRRQNLMALRDNKASGSAAALARLIGREASYVTRMLYPEGKPGKKRIGEDMAGAIEAALSLPKGSLDAPIGTEKTDEKEPQHPIPLMYPVSGANVKRVWVVGKAMGGLPDRVWGDGGYPVGRTNDYAEVATTDPQAFLCPITGESMIPRFNPGEFALVEPNTAPELEDDVLVRLRTGETMLKRLLSRRGGIRLGSYNQAETFFYQPEEIAWMYYVPHPVPARKIKTAI